MSFRVGWEKTGPMRNRKMTVSSKIPTIEDIREILGPALADSEASKAVVFGSYARGEADERSDLDMLIVSDTDKRFLQRIEDYWPVFSSWWRLRKGFDLLVYTPEEVSNMLAIGNTFIHKALSEGVVIYER